MDTKYVNCATCDIACQLVATREHQDQRYTLDGDMDNPLAPGAICAKGRLSHDIFDHPNRVTKPLKRIGERGEGQWQEISWDQAMDEIAEKLKDVVDQHGPEALGVSSGPWNSSTESGMTRRFMNLLGSPNYISPVALCMGNTAAVNKLTYGWFPFPDFENTECVVLFGHNPHNQSWVMEYIRLRLAEQRGAKLIVLDPRRSQSADRADIYLPLKPGTDAAMCLGWLNVIIGEELYDKAFVEEWTTGFEQLKQRVLNEYPLAKVASITGVDEALIRKAARTYAGAKGAIIPWTAITDQQNSSTSAIRLQSILRALTGNLDAPGGEMMMAPDSGVISESELELHHLLPLEQKQKQLGFNEHPVFTYNSMEKLREPAKRVWGMEYPNQVKGTCMAVPPNVFRAMAHGDPYPVKAFFSIANNTLMGYANQRLIHDALMNQDLLVSFEQFVTPTANLSDYILPGDSWLERPNLHGAFEWGGIIQVSDQLYPPAGECRNVYDFWKGLAKRMGMDKHFPWPDLEALFDYRVSRSEASFSNFKDKYKTKIADYEFYKYRKTGFATPSGKVELYSSMLDEWGFDPLPYHRDPPSTSQEFPLQLFVGVREPQFFQSGQRHVEALRKSNREPRTFLHKDDAARFGLQEGDWANIESINGVIKMKVLIRDDMPKGLVRIPHGWWKPENTDLGTWDHNDAIIVADYEEYLDREQGIPHLKGIPCKIYPLAQETRAC